jgi:NDP-sugar pyrophosphorylase family protein
MNFFGFTLSALPCFQDFFDRFIQKNAGSEKAEALLPDAANGLVKDGEGKIRVFTSEESWFGMTYPEDKAIVKREIAKKIKDGYYPEKLWGND